MNRAYYTDSIDGFLEKSPDEIVGVLVQSHAFALDPTQRDAWTAQITILREILLPYRGAGQIHFEYSIPRLGKRIDAVVLIGGVVFVLEFKVGETEFSSHALDQVWDYALDLKNFHETSHDCPIAPVLIATAATAAPVATPQVAADRLIVPLRSSAGSLGEVIAGVLAFAGGTPIDFARWAAGRYSPTPTIIEAATALFAGHSVIDISRNDAGAVNLSQTSDSIAQIIKNAKAKSEKAICFVTGVPGAGKTLVGLNIATQHIDRDEELHSVFLSGNGPLVAILREALARDRVQQARQRGAKVKKGEAMSEVKLFVQNVHHFRDECLVDHARPPIEHVALFDEAQRAWNLEQTASFMLRKRKRPDFTQSEPEFLISCLDRHQDWAVVVCLVGGGQEINTGEAGISEWIDSLIRSFPAWRVYISSRLVDSEYTAGEALSRLQTLPHVRTRDDLHLSVSMRSFRAENVSLLVKQLLDYDEHAARQTLQEITGRFPIVLTRCIKKAKQWLKEQARGSERYGMVVSSEAQRLKPHAIDVRSPMDPIHWFLDAKDDVRSSYYLEDVATEFHVQGLELDWTCVTWDADFRHTKNGWEHWSFCGNRWNRIRKAERQVHLKNAYRVLLTRARQGMVIVVPEGTPTDPTRSASYYDPTFHYLAAIGLAVI